MLIKKFITATFLAATLTLTANVHAGNAQGDFFEALTAPSVDKFPPPPAMAPGFYANTIRALAYIEIKNSGAQIPKPNMTQEQLDQASKLRLEMIAAKTALVEARLASGGGSGNQAEYQNYARLKAAYESTYPKQVQDYLSLMDAPQWIPTGQ